MPSFGSSENTQLSTLQLHSLLLQVCECYTQTRKNKTLNLKFNILKVKDVYLALLHCESCPKHILLAKVESSPKHHEQKEKNTEAETK